MKLLCIVCKYKKLTFGLLNSSHSLIIGGWA